MTQPRIIRTLPADLLTPVGAYLLLRDALGAPGFLLESVERGEQVGRHSFLAAGCATTDSLDEAVAFAALAARARPPGEPPFVGGAVGHLSYDWVARLEPVPLPAAHPDDAGLPEMRFMLADAVVAFDHVRRTMSLIGEPARVEQLECGAGAAAGGRARCRRWRGRRDRTLETTREHYMAAVERAREHIAAGDAFQIVPSQRMRRQTARLAVCDLPRAARRSTPRPTCSCSTTATSSWSARRRRCTCGWTWTAPASCGRSPAPARAAPRRRGRRAGRRAAGLGEGPRRARDAGRPRPQRRRPRLRAGQRAGDAVDGGRALLARHAHRLAT